MVFSLLSPLISFLDPKFQTIAVPLMHNLYATIGLLKVIRIINIVLLVETNFIIQMIQDRQLLSSLKINSF